MESGCDAWDVECKIIPYCSCIDCNIEALFQLPFHQALLRYLDDKYEEVDHRADCLAVLEAAVRAENAILRLLALERIQPSMTSKSTNRRIMKHFLLLLSIALYDAQFINYNGTQFSCDCPELLLASKAVKKLTCLCLVNNIDFMPMWSFLDRALKTTLNLLHF